jgi:hypothetical protein
MDSISWERRAPVIISLSLVGLLMGGLLIGYEPVGGDPDRLYRPLKQELARFLSQGRLPLWSDRFGLGVPLLAESHVAAFYPPNWVLYALLSVPAAYRLAMWSHYLFLAASTFFYARFLKISSAGAAIAAIGFTFCGFQAIHSSHEPFYHALPYLPLALLLAEWYLASGRAVGLILLAVAWGAQLTLGHFQLQWWTAGLLLFLGLWRAAFDGRPRFRVLAIVLALAWGAAMASIQLTASWELARFVGFTHRSFADLVFYGYPAAHWAEVAIPTLLRGIPGGPEAGYWYAQGTTGYEACLYVGTLPLILAFVALAGRGNRALAAWLLVIATSLVLAMLPGVWPDAYRVVTRVPGFGWFRAPGRYTVLTCLGLCLLAGRGLDCAREQGSWPRGLIVAWVFGLAAAGWAACWALRSDHAVVLGGRRLVLCLGAAGIAWVLATALTLGWRSRRIGSWPLLLATAVELGCLYYTSTTVWGWAVDLPGQSRVLARLADEPDVRRVAGLLHDLPVRAGATPLYPSTGFTMPPPHPALEFATRRAEAFSPGGLAMLRRFGVTHGIWDGPVPKGAAEVLLEAEDPILDRLVFKPPGAPARATWRLVRYPAAFPEARAATRAEMASGESSLLSAISIDSSQEAVWYRAGELPVTLLKARAQKAGIASWDGRSATVEHDGSCDLVINRTFYPGWFASVNDGRERPVHRAEIGIQSVLLEGSGTSTVRFDYRPEGMQTASVLAIAATGLALLGLLVEGVRFAQGRRIPPEIPKTSP